MAKEGRRATKITKREAHEAAQRLLNAISGRADTADADAFTVVEGLSPSALAEVLRAVRDQAGSCAGTPDPARLAGVVLRCSARLNRRTSGNYMVAATRAMMAIDNGPEREATAGLLSEMIAALMRKADSRWQSPVYAPDIQAIAREVDRIDEILVTTLFRIGAIKDDRERSAMQRGWASFLLPLLGIRASGTGVAPAPAARMLDLLAETDPGTLPDDLVVLVPALAARAEPQARQRLLDTRLGTELAARSQMPFGADAGKAGASGSDSPGGDTGSRFSDSEELLTAIRIFLSEQDERVSTAEEATAGALEQVRTLESRLKEMSSRLHSSEAAYRRDMAGLTDALNEARAQAEQASRTRDDALAELQKWRREVELVDRESQSLVNDNRRAAEVEAAKRLTKPSRNVRQHILRVLETDAAAHDLRSLAIAFDQLHRQIIRICALPEEERIPVELLRPKGERKET